MLTEKNIANVIWKTLVISSNSVEHWKFLKIIRAKILTHLAYGYYRDSDTAFLLRRSKLRQVFIDVLQECKWISPSSLSFVVVLKVNYILSSNLLTKGIVIIMVLTYNSINTKANCIWQKILKNNCKNIFSSKSTQKQSSGGVP